MSPLTINTSYYTHTEGNKEHETTNFSLSIYSLLDYTNYNNISLLIIHRGMKEGLCSLRCTN